MNHYLAKNSHTLMIEPPEIIVDDVISWGYDEISDCALYGERSREIDIHVTVINGIKDNFDNVYRNICLERQFNCKLTELNLFTANKKFDVLYIKVESQELINLNRKLKNSLFVESEYKNYIPHLTIAYLKKEKGNCFIGSKFFEGEVFQVNALNFNSRFGVKTIIDMEKK